MSNTRLIYFLSLLVMLFSCLDDASLDCPTNQELESLEIGKEALSFFNVGMQNKSQLILKNTTGKTLKLQIDTKPLAGSRDFLNTNTALRKTLACDNNTTFEVTYDAEYFELGLFEPEKGFFILFQINPLFEFFSSGNRFNFYDYISVSYNGSGGATETMLFSNKAQETIEPVNIITQQVESLIINGKEFKEVYKNERNALSSTLLLNRNQGIVGIFYEDQWWAFDRLE